MNTRANGPHYGLRPLSGPEGYTSIRLLFDDPIFHSIYF
jgi:hypothetical protein